MACRPRRLWPVASRDRASMPSMASPRTLPIRWTWHQRQWHRPGAHRKPERVRQSSQGLAVPRCARAADPGEDIGPARGHRVDDAPDLFTRGRLDHRTDDLSRRRLDHASVGIANFTVPVDPRGQQSAGMDGPKRAPGRRSCRVRAHHDDTEPGSDGRLHRNGRHRLRLRGCGGVEFSHRAIVGSSRSRVSGLRERSRRSRPTSGQRSTVAT